jgi:hypothetical protein
MTITPAAAAYGPTNFDWVFVDEVADKRATEIRRALKVSLSPEQTKKCIRHIIQYYLEERLRDHNNVRWAIKLFEEAQQSNNINCLLKAYTIDSAFYRMLNRDLAGDYFNNNTENQNYHVALTYILVLFFNIFQLNNKLTYKGECFRGLSMSENDYKQYKIGCRLLFKSFQSTSALRERTESFAKANTSEQLKATFKFTIKYSPTAINIKDDSTYKHEEEILVYPYSVFEVKSIQEDSNGIYIEFEECKTEMTDY